MDYVDYWYSPDGPQAILCSSAGMRTWDAKALSIPSKGLPRTTSHYLWLRDERWHLIDNSDKQTAGLVIFGLKGGKGIVF